MIIDSLSLIAIITTVSIVLLLILNYFQGGYKNK